jgi:hypothetical protein
MENELLEAQAGRDLALLEAMLEVLPDYLTQDELYYPLNNPDWPRLTLGGFLLRLRLVEAAYNRLDDSQREAVQRILVQFNEVVQEYKTHLLARLHAEFQARLRQWEHYLQELENDPAEHADFYASEVENRLVLQLLDDFLASSQVSAANPDAARLVTLDRHLADHWQHGDFILPGEVQSAYTGADDWWLYGWPDFPEKDE